MTHLDDQTAKALKFDGLGTAEQATGKSYKEDKLTEALGFMMHVDNVERKNAMLLEQDDTVFSNELDRYLRICGELGFEVALKLPFVGKNDWGNDAVGWRHEERDEELYALWHPDGLLLKFDTYSTAQQPKHVNGGQVDYEWEPKPGEVLDVYRDVLSSTRGQYEGDTLVCFTGSHDCREALRFHLKRLREYGTFNAVWKYPPFYMQLLNYQDYHDSEGFGREAANAHRQISLARWELLPEHVRVATAVWGEYLRKEVTW